MGRNSHGTAGRQGDSSPPRRAIRANGSQGGTIGSAGAITRERIQSRAYDIYMARRMNGDSGDETSDWLQAEREINGSASPGAEIEARKRGEALLAGGE